MSNNNHDANSAHAHETENSHIDDVEILHGDAGHPDFDTGTEIVNNRIEDFVSAQMLVPSVEWIHKHVVAHGKGYQVPLATLIGVAYSAEKQTNQVQGKAIENVKLIGKFETTIHATGEVLQTKGAFLPRKWAELVLQALEAVKDDPSARADMDITIGVRATGKAIPYAWTINSHRQQENDRELDHLRRQSKLRLNLPSRQPQPVLEHAAE